MKKLSPHEEFLRDWRNIALKEHVDTCERAKVARTTKRVMSASAWPYIVTTMNALFPGQTKKFDFDKLEGAVLSQNWVRYHGPMMISWPKKKFREFLKKNAKRFLADKNYAN